jgi:hypothetical protein
MRKMTTRRSSRDFVAAWTKVMNAVFDLAKTRWNRPRSQRRRGVHLTTTISADGCLSLQACKVGQI